MKEVYDSSLWNYHARLSLFIHQTTLMVRIFNIYFTYKDVTHSAIVSVHQDGMHTEYTLKNFDASLLDVLPGIKIISEPRKELKFADAHSKPNHVMQQILNAVSSHMELIPI